MIIIICNYTICQHLKTLLRHYWDVHVERRGTTKQTFFYHDIRMVTEIYKEKKKCLLVNFAFRAYNQL